MFERIGMLCRHIIWVYSGRGIKKIPEQYIKKRWTKDATRASGDIDIIDGKQTEMTKLWSEFHKTVGSLRGKDNNEVKKLQSLIREFRIGLVPECEPMNKHQELEQILGCQATNEIEILPPKLSKNKGGGKRMLSSKTKAIAKAKKQKRLCANCKRMAHHDKRNCPNPFSKKAPTGEQTSEDDDSGKDESDSETSM